MAGQLCIALGISLDEHFRGSFSDKCINVIEIYQKMSNWLSIKEKKFSSYEEYFLEIFKWLDEEKNNEKIDKQEYERVKAILKAVYAEMFINEVKIERECDTDDCEYEVTKKAMEMYLKYPYYKKWNIQERENKHGAYILKKDKQALTADILTSINSIWKKFSSDTSKRLGSAIWKSILGQDNFFNDNDFPEQIRQYMKAFAIVYYWCGNMMPVPSQDSFGSNGADNWIYKMMLLRSFFKGESISEKHDNWKRWVEENWRENDDWKESWKKFIYGNYLIDCCDGKSYQIKNIVSNAKRINSLSKDNFNVLIDDEFKLAKEFLANHVRMIIQRSYRIQYQFSKDWKDSAKDEENVKSIMRYVFKQAGFNEKEIEAENLATIF